MGQEGSGQTTEANPLGLALGFVEGKALVTLRDYGLSDGITLRALELELAEVEFPLDLQGGAEEFQRRSTRLVHLVLEVQLTQVARALNEGLTSQDRALRDVGLIFEGGRLILEGRLGPEGPPVAAEVVLGPAEADGLEIHVRGLEQFGASTACALGVPRDLEVAIRAALTRLGTPVSDAVGARGAAVIALDPVAAILWAVLPTHGWKVPRSDGVPVRKVAFTRSGAVQIIVGTSRAGYEPAPAEVVSEQSLLTARAREDAERLLPAIEAQLSSGAIRSAFETLRAELDGPGKERVLEQTLLVATADAVLFPEAMDLAKDRLGTDPEHVPSRLLRAIIAESEGRSAEARAEFELAARALRKAGRRRRAGLAYRAAARHAEPGSAQRARLLEETIALRPDDVIALEGLVETLPGLGRASAAVRAARRLANLGKDPAVRVRAHLAAGRLLFEQVEDPVAAKRELERALKLAPDDPEVLEVLARAVIAKGEPRRAARILERLIQQAERASDMPRAARLSTQLGDLWRPLDPEAALARYQHARQLAPEAAGPLLAIAQTALETGQTDAALEAIDDAVPHLDRVTADSELEEVVALRLFAGRLYAGTGDRSADAVAQLEAVLQLDPDHAEAMTALTQLHDERGDRTAAAQMRARRAAAALARDDLDEAVALFGAQLEDGDATEQSDLCDRLREAVEAHPTHRGLLELLVRATEASGDPDRRIDALDRRLLLEDPPAVRSGLWAQLGAVLEAADRAPDAIRAFEEALAADPDRAEAAFRLVDLYRARADEGRLETALARAARVAPTPADQSALHAERSRLLADRGDDGEAWSAMQDALRHGDVDPTLLPFATALALRNGATDEARELIERRLAQAADQPASARLPCFVDLANVEEIVGDRDALVSALERAYDAADPATEAGSRLGRRLARELYAQEDYARLAQLERRRGAVASAPIAERAEHHLDAARFFVRLRAHEEAEADVQTVLRMRADGELEPQVIEAALDVLDTVAERLADPDRRAHALVLRADLTSGAAADELRVRAAGVHVAAGHREAALSVLESDGVRLLDSRVLLARRGELLEEAGDTRGAAESYGNAARIAENESDATAAVELHGRAAAAYAAAQMGEAAVGHDRAVLALAPDVGPQWLGPALDRLEVHAREAADATLLADVLGRRAEVAEPAAAARLLLEKANLHLDTQGQDKDGLAALRQAHELESADVEVADAVDGRFAEALERMGLFAEQAAVLSRWAERGLDGHDKADRLHRAAEVYARRLRDRSMALSRAQAAVRADPSHEPARDLRIALLREEGRTEALAEALAEEAEASTDASSASARWLEAAELIAPPQHVGDSSSEALDRALGLVRRAATAAPTEPGPVIAEARYSRALGRPDDELSALGRLVERPLAPAVKVAAHLRRAQLLSGALGDDLAAQADLDLALPWLLEASKSDLEATVSALPTESRPAFIPDEDAELTRGVLRVHAELAERLEDWPAYVRSLMLLVERIESPAERASLRVRAGEVLEWRLGDGAAAEREYLTALATVPNHREARRALSQFYVAVDRFGDLAESLGVEALVEVFEGLGEREPAHRVAAAAQALWPVLPKRSSERADVQLRLADQFALQGLDDERVHVLDMVARDGPRPHRSEALTRLRAFYEAQGRDDLYCDVLRRQAEIVEADDARAQALAELGEALEWKIGDGQGAEREYRAALAVDPECASARRRLVELLAAQDRFEELGRDLGQDVLRLVVDEILEQGPRDRERAFAAAGALSQLVDEAEAGALWIDVADALRAAPDNETARIREALESAAESPSVRATALERLADLLERVGEHAALADVLARRANEASEPADRRALLVSQAKLHLAMGDRGERPVEESDAAAERALNLVLQTTPEDPEASELLGEVLSRGRRWGELADLLGVEALADHEGELAADRSALRDLLEARASRVEGVARAQGLVELVAFADLDSGDADSEVPRTAEALYQAALVADPENISAQEGLRVLLEADGRFRDIGEQISPAALRDTIRGLKQLDRGAQLLPATLALAAVLGAHPEAVDERVRLYVEAAAMHQSEEDTEAAEHALRTALELDPEHVVAREELSGLLTKQGRLEELADLDPHLVAHAAAQASELGDQDLEVRALRVLAGRQDGRTRADTLVLVAALEKERGHVDAAEVDLERALDDAPDHGLARTELESILWATDRYVDAYDKFGHAAFLNRGATVAEEDPARLLRATKAVEEAVAGAAQAEIYELSGRARAPDADIDEDWARRVQCLDRAKSIWDERSDAEGAVRTRMALVDLVRERDDPGALLDALQDALQHATLPEDRATLAIERATLLALLDKPEEARQLVQPVLLDSAVPDEHRRGAARILVEDLIRGDLETLPDEDLDVRARALEVLTDPQDAGAPIAWLLELAQLREIRGADADDIAGPLEAALEGAPNPSQALTIRRQLQGLYEELGDWRRAEAHASVIANAADDPDQWVQVSELRAWLDDRQGAEDALQKALAHDASHGPAHASLLRLAEQSGATDSVIERLQTWADADAEGDVDERLQRIQRALELAARSGDADKAVELAERAVAIAPADRIEAVAEAADSGLEGLDATESQVALLSQVVSGHPQVGSGLRLRLADLLQSLDRADEARTVIEGGLHRDTPERDPLVDRVAAQGDGEPDDRSARRLLAVAGRLKSGPAARRLLAVGAERAEAAGEHALAQSAWTTFLGQVAAGPRAVDARAALVRLARLGDDPQVLLSALLESVDDAETAEDKAARLVEAAELADELESPTQAEALYRRARKAAPEDLALADRFIEHLRSRGRWMDIDAEWQARAETTAGAERAAICLARAELAHRELKDELKAARLWVEGYEADPSASVGRRAVESLQLAGAPDEALALAERVVAATAADDPELGPLQRIRADVLESLGRADEAVTVLRAEARAHPGSMLVQDRLRSLLARHERFAELADFLIRLAEDIEPADGLRSLLAAARIRLERLDDAPGAKVALAAGLAMVDGWLSAPGGPIPDDIAPPPASGAHLSERAVFEAPLLDLAALAARIDASDLRVSALRLYAQSLAEGLAQWRVLLLLAGAERESGDLDAAEFTLRGVVDAIRDAAEVDVADRAEAERALGALLLDRGAPQDAVEALGRAEALLRERSAETDAERAEVLVLLAEAHRTAGAAGAAVDALTQARMLAPDRVSQAQLDEVIEAGGASPARAALEVRRASEVLVPSERAARLRAAAAVWEEIGQPDEAFAPLLEAYEADPSNSAEAARLEDLLYSAERWTDMERLLARRLEAEDLTGEARRTVLVTRARLLESQLDRAEDAVPLLREAAARDPRPDVLQELARVALVVGQADVEQDALARLATVAEAPELRRAALLARARSLGRSSRASTAAPALEEAVELSLSEGLAVTPLAEALDRLYAQRGDHASRAKLWVRVAAVREGPAAAAAYARAAQVRLDALEDRRGAASALEAACRHAPEDLGLRRAGLSLAETLGDGRRAVTHAAAGAAAAVSQGRPEAAASFWRAQARALAASGQTDQELEVWSQLLEHGPSPAALDELVTRVRESLPPERVEPMLEAAAAAASSDTARARVLLARARVLDDPLGRHWEAEGLREDAGRLDPEVAPAFDAAQVPEDGPVSDADYRSLRSMLDRSGRWSELADLEEGQAARLGSRAARARALLEVARLHAASHTAEAEDRADDALARAARLDPDLVEAHAERLRLQVSRQDWAGAAASVEHLDALGGPPWAMPELELVSATVAEANHDRDRARAALFRALARDPDNVEARARLARLDPLPSHLSAWAERLDPILDAETLTEVAVARSDAALAAGEVAAALEHAEAAVRADPHSRLARSARRRALEGDGSVDRLVDALVEEARLAPPEGAVDTLITALELARTHGLERRTRSIAEALGERGGDIPEVRQRLIDLWCSVGDGPALLRAMDLAGGPDALEKLTDDARSRLGGALIDEGRVEEAWAVLLADAPEGDRAALIAALDRGELVAVARRVARALAPDEPGPDADGTGRGWMALPAVRARLRDLFEDPREIGPHARGALARIVVLSPRETALGEALATASRHVGSSKDVAAQYRALLAQDPSNVAWVRALQSVLDGPTGSGVRAVATWLEHGRGRRALVPRLTRSADAPNREALGCVGPLAEALALGASALSRVLPPGFEPGPGRRAAAEDPRIADIWESVQAVLSHPPMVSVDPEGGAGVRLEPGEVPTLVIGEALVEQAGPEELRFHFARAAFLVQHGYLLVQQARGLARSDFLGMLADAAEGSGDQIIGLDPAARRRLAELAPHLRGATDFDLARWRSGLLRAADRFGVLVAGDLGSAVVALDRLEPRAIGERRDTIEDRVAAVRRWGPIADLLGWLIQRDFGASGAPVGAGARF